MFGKRMCTKNIDRKYLLLKEINLTVFLESMRKLKAKHKSI